MPWLLEFMERTFQALPDDLNATVMAENDEFEVAVFEGDKMWSFVGSKITINVYGYLCTLQHARFWHSILVSEIRLQVKL